MKTPLLVLLSLAALSGCSGTVRTPETYRDDTGKVLATRNAVIQQCYDAVVKASPDAKGTVTVNFEVSEDTGAIGNVTVNKEKTTAPDAVSDCVTKNIADLKIDPPVDSKKGLGMWSYEFTPPVQLPPAPPPAKG